MKKTNIRIRRNGGSKSVSPQVPNKPETAAQIPPTAFPKHDLDSAVNSAFALLELMKHRLTYGDDGSLPEERAIPFQCGLISLTSAVQKDLVNARDSFYESLRMLKAGAR